MLTFDNLLNLFVIALAFSLVGLNVFITRKILNVLDITCDISLPLGGCIYVALTLCGAHPVMAFIIAVSSGAIVGFITSSLILNVRLEPIFASIITVTAFQTLVVKLISFQKNEAISSSPIVVFIVGLTIVLTIYSIMFKFLHSEYGLAMRVCGNGKIISESLGINTEKILSVGLAIGNSLSAIAGVLLVQVHGVANAGMGTGALIFGIGAIMVGEKFIGNINMGKKIVGCFVGAFFYKFIMELVLVSSYNDSNEYNGVIIGLVLILLMALVEDNKNRKVLDSY